MDGVTVSKASFVVTDITKFIAAIDDGRVSLKIENHKTRSAREIYYLHATIGGVANKLYFALPSGQSLELLEDEVPKLIMKIPLGESGVAVSTEMAKFESDYRSFMQSKVEPLLITSANIDSKKIMHLANFGKAESASSKFCLLALPRAIKPDQITRLIEAKGSQVLVNIAYMYTISDTEKGKVVYGSIFEAGRFPYISKSESTSKPSVGKRKANFDLLGSNKDQKIESSSSPAGGSASELNDSSVAIEISSPDIKIESV